MSALKVYPLLSQAVELTRSDAWPAAKFSGANQPALTQELAIARADTAALAEILHVYNVEPERQTPAFWGWLERLVVYGGFGEPVENFAQGLTAALIAGSEPTRRQELIKELNDRRASFFFSGGRWVTADLFARNFPVGFAADWIAARFVAYGHDGAVSDLWRLLHCIVEEKPEYAFDLARTPVFAARVEGRKFQIDLLGGLRFRAGLPSTVSDQLPVIFEAMRTSPDAAERANYWRTMKRPLALGRLPDSELELALAATALSQEEYGVGYELAKAGSRAPTPKVQTLQLLQWLSAQLDQPRTPEQQYDAATVVRLTVEQVTPAELGFDVVDLLLKIQPIDKAHHGIWQQVESVFFPLWNLSRERFHRLLRLMARTQWGVLLKMLEPNAPLHGAMSRLGECPDETAAFAADLIASAQLGERRLGFYLTESLELPTTKEPGTIFTREGFIIWLAEFRLNIVYRTVASQLAGAAARIDSGDAEMVHAFQEEVLYQCKNLPGLCLSQLKEKRTALPLLDPPLTEAEAYFEVLQKLHQSPIKAQQIPGLVRAIGRKRARDQIKMDEAVAAHSIFEQFVKKSYLIYGTRWATFHGGSLGKESVLQKHSVSAEYPRKAVIDPEGFLAIKLSAQSQLKGLKPSEEAEST